LLHGEAQLRRERFGALERRRKHDLLGERFDSAAAASARELEPREYARRRGAKAFRLRAIEPGTKRALVRVAGEHVVDRGRGRRRGERGRTLSANAVPAWPMRASSSRTATSSRRT
jgi:hypothetical protein